MRGFTEMLNKKSLFLTIIPMLALASCGFLEEKSSGANTATNTEIDASFESDSDGGLKRPDGCYPDYAATEYDYSDVNITYQLKITSGDYVQVCISSENAGPTSVIINLDGKNISFYATNTPVTALGDLLNPADAFSINGTDGRTSFPIRGSGVCSWITNGTEVGTLNMEDYTNYKYIVAKDSCGMIAGFGMSPYEKSRQIGD